MIMTRPIAQPECRVCGDVMKLSGRFPRPLRRRYDCPNCGSWVSILTAGRAIYREHWRRDW